MPKLRDLPLFRLHDAHIHVPRVRRIADAIVSLVPEARAMLDIGCGNGLLAKDVAERVGAASLVGVDVKVRPEAVIEARAYDGLSLPFDDACFDLVTINDVLHHATEPGAVLNEAVRVLRPGGAVVIKDHFRTSALGNAVLFAMDWVGNVADGVHVTGEYLSPSEWVDLVATAGGRFDRLLWPFVVHALPWRLVARSEYQFVARVRAVRE